MTMDCSTKVLRLVAVFAAVGCLGFILVSEHSCLTAYSRAAAPTTTFFPEINSSESSAAASTPKDACLSNIKMLDATFDERRRQRRALPAKTVEVLMYFDPYEPEAVCFHEERFGLREGLPRYVAYGDGPKFICGVDFLAARNKEKKERGEPPCLVYSVGSANNVGFEAAVTQYTQCEVHTFDPTLTKPFVGDKYATFHPWGLGNDGEHVTFGASNFTTKSLETIVKDLGHTGRTIDVLKIDCEGCEWHVMPKVFDSMKAGNLKIDQVLIEVHTPYLPGGTGDAHVAFLKKFFEQADDAGLRIFHKERNHWGCVGYKCVEYAFVSESFLTASNSQICG